MAVCSYGLNGEARWQDQQPWLAGAAISAAVIFLGMTFWTLAGLRTVRAEKRAMNEELRVALELGHTLLGVIPVRRQHAGAMPTVGNTRGRVTSPGMTRYHDPDCVMMRRKPVVPLALSEDGSTAALSACQICQA